MPKLIPQPHWPKREEYERYGVSLGDFNSPHYGIKNWDTVVAEAKNLSHTYTQPVYAGITRTHKGNRFTPVLKFIDGEEQRD